MSRRDIEALYRYAEHVANIKAALMTCPSAELAVTAMRSLAWLISPDRREEAQRCECTCKHKGVDE